MIFDIKNSRKAQNVEEIFISGEQSQRKKEENQKLDYLDIEDTIINDIEQLLQECN